MAQTGFTPIQIYYSTTSSNLPLAANLTNGELAINSADGKLFYKDSGGTVQTLASQNLFASQTANYVYASPNGSAGVPTFRALVAADIPSLSGSYVPYTGAASAVDLNAKTLVNVANLGINTTTVPTILVRAVGDNNSNSRIAMRGYSSNANSSSMRVTKFRGSAGTPQAPLSGDSLGKFELAGYGTTSSDGYAQASFEGVATENWGAAARGAKTLIKVTPNTTTTQVTAVTVDQDSKATFAGALAVTGHTTFEGVTSTGATGTGKLVYDTSPTLVTPTIGVATATSINKMAITAPATSSTLAVADGKTLTANKTLTLDGTDSTTMTFPTTSATIARTDAAQTFTGAQTFSTAIAVGSGGTGLTSFTSGGVVYASSTSALTTSANLTFDGTNLIAAGYIKATGSYLLSTANSGNGYISPQSASACNIGTDFGTLNLVAGTVGVAAKIDTAGTFGLGVTPSAWSGYKTMQTGIASFSGGATGAYLISDNAYTGDGGASWKYIASSYAPAQYYAAAGNHVWRTAASGTAGNTITFVTGMELSSARALKLNAYGAGALTSDASGNITAVSDEAVKKNIRPFNRGLAEIVAIANNPSGVILYGYTLESGLDQTKNDYAGWSAQVVQQSIPEAVGKMTDEVDANGVVIKEGCLTLNPFGIVAAQTKAIAELNSIIEKLTLRIELLEQK